MRWYVVSSIATSTPMPAKPVKPGKDRPEACRHFPRSFIADRARNTQKKSDHLTQKRRILQ
jgi:hypothetical protein